MCFRAVRGVDVARSGQTLTPAPLPVGEGFGLEAPGCMRLNPSPLGRRCRQADEGAGGARRSPSPSASLTFVGPNHPWRAALRLWPCGPTLRANGGALKRFMGAKEPPYPSRVEAPKDGGALASAPRPKLGTRVRFDLWSSDCRARHDANVRAGRTLTPAPLPTGEGFWLEAPRYCVESFSPRRRRRQADEGVGGARRSPSPSASLTSAGRAEAPARCSPSTSALRAHAQGGRWGGSLRIMEHQGHFIRSC